MKKLIIFAGLMLGLMGMAYADTVTLNNTEEMFPPSATQIEFKRILIDLNAHHMIVWYSWRDSGGVIQKDGKIIHTWSIGNISDDPETDNALCVGEGDPWPCCTGAGTGECDESDPAFNNLFLFQVRQQDVGTPIGRGLRNLIWSRMKNDILSEGNDGSFGN